MIIHYRPDIVENLSMQHAVLWGINLTQNQAKTPPTKQVHSIYSEILINNFGDNDD